MLNNIQLANFTCLHIIKDNGETENPMKSRKNNIYL